MSDRIERISLEKLEGMTQPEAYLFGADEAPPSLDEFVEPEEDLSLRRVTNKSRRRVIKQQATSQDTPPDLFARQLKEPTATEIQEMQRKVRLQPVLYTEVKKIQKKSEQARTLGSALGMIMFVAYFALTKGAYFKTIQDLEPLKMPKWVPSSIENAITGAPWPDGAADIAAITLGAILPLLFLIALMGTAMLLLRILLLKRFTLAVPAVIGLLTSFYLLVAFNQEADNLNVIRVLIVAVFLLIVMRIAESLGKLAERLLGGKG